MGTLKVLTGNYAAAEAAAKCRLDLIAAYPITPQSSVVEHLAELVYNGEIDTDMVQVLGQETLTALAGEIPAGRLGRPEEVATAVLSLVENPYITGQVLTVDGGFLV